MRELMDHKTLAMTERYAHLVAREYVQEIFKTAEYKPCEDSDYVVAIAKALPGCMTQGRNVEEARELPIDTIEIWLLSAIKDGENLPEVKE